MGNQVGKIIRLTRESAAELGNHISQAATVTRAENEDPEIFKKFKYAAGKNYDRLKRVVDQTNNRQAKIYQYTDAYKEFLQKRENICMALAEKDAEGSFSIEGDPQNPTFKFSAKNEPIAQERIKKLEEEYQAALDEMKSREEQARELELEEISVELHTVPFGWVPEKLSGGFMYAIRDMVRDIPEELLGETTEGSAG